MDLSAALTCPSCGYDLRATRDGICPECGTHFDPEKLRQSKIPWAYRHSFGRFKAYCKTAAWVMIHPSQLADEVHKPLNFSDAKQFRNVTAGILAVPLVVAFIGAAFNADMRGPAWAHYFVFIAAALTLGFLLPIFLTGVQSYLYHPRRIPIQTQNRAIGLSYYTSAPLALIWILGPGALIWIWICNWKLLRIVDAGLIRKSMLPMLWLGCLAFTAFLLASITYATLVIITW